MFRQERNIGKMNEKLQVFCPIWDKTKFVVRHFYRPVFPTGNFNSFKLLFKTE